MMNLPLNANARRISSQRLAFLFLKDSAELLGLALLVNITLHHGNFQIFTVKSQMVIKHFCKNTKNRRLVFIAKSFDVDIKQNRFRRSFGSTVNQHKGCRIILKLFAKNALHFGCLLLLCFQKIGKHFQKVRFTTSKETRNPDTHIGSRLVKRIPVIIEECNEMFLPILW